MTDVAARGKLRKSQDEDSRVVGLENVRRSTLKDQSYLRLRTAVLSGRFEPGAQVTVKELAEQLGSGVMPVREAVQRLIAEGAFQSLPTGRVLAPRLRRQDFEEILELRLLLEPLAAARAAKTADAAVKEELARWEDVLNRSLRATVDLHEAVHANYRFHFTVYSAASAPLLTQHIETLWLRAGPMMIHLFGDKGMTPESYDTCVRVHRALREAVENNDPAAATTAMESTLAAAAAMYRATYPFQADI